MRKITNICVERYLTEERDEKRMKEMEEKKEMDWREEFVYNISSRN